jgi:hypothetical protein
VEPPGCGTSICGRVEDALLDHRPRALPAFLAGLEHRDDVPGEPVAPGRRQVRGPTSIAVGRSWPQPCITPGTVEVQGSPARAVIGAATLAACWERLTSQGPAWVTAYPGGSYRRVTLALVELDCLPRTRAGVLAEVCRDPRVVTVEESIRGRDVLRTDLRELFGAFRAQLDNPLITRIGPGSSW